MNLKLRISVKEKVIGVPDKPQAQTIKAMFTVEQPITVELVDDESEIVIKSAE